MARRAPLSRGPHPRARVRHEGRVQLRPRRCRARRELPGPVRRLRADLRAARARGRRGVVRRGHHGRDRCPRVHGPQPRWRGRPGPVRVVRLRRQPPGRGRAEARGQRGGPTATRGRRDTRDDDDRHVGGVPRDRREQDRQGGLLHDRRRSPGDGHRARRLRGQRDEARQRRERGRWHPAGDGRGDPGGWDGARLRLADRCPRHDRGHRRPGRALTEPRRRGEPRGVPRPQRQRRARLQPRRDRRHHECAGGRSLSGLRHRRHPPQRHRGRQHLQARDEVHRRVRGHLPRRGRRGPSHRHGLVRDRRRVATSPASSRPITTRRGSSGRPRSRPTPPTS